MLMHLLTIFLLPFLLSVQGLGNGDVIHERADIAKRATGDTQCVDLMCLSASSDGSTVEYVLQSTGNRTMTWMAMGFGTKMTNSPMVIMWPNSDGSVTLSQRKASGHVMPTVDPSPPRTATFSASLTSLGGTQPKLGYTIPANTDEQQNVIWAFGIVPPSSSAVDATLQQHLDSGTLVLDLTKQITSSNGSSTSTTTSTGGTSPTSSKSSNIRSISTPNYVAASCILTSVFFFLLPFHLVR